MPRLSALSLLPPFACAILLLAVQPLCAQGDDEQGDLLYYTYTAPGWGVRIGLGSHGTLLEAGDPALQQSQLDWQWLSDEDDLALWPIYRIDGATVTASSDPGFRVTEEAFRNSYTVMSEKLNNNPHLFLIETEENHSTSTGRHWHIFHYNESNDNGTPDDSSDDSLATCYSCFTSDDGIVRMVSFYYIPFGGDLDWLTAVEIYLALDPEFEGDGYDYWRGT